MKKDLLDEKCKGCKALDEGCPLIFYYANTDECPCFKCLVKIMCSQACDDWRKIRNEKIQNGEIRIV
jgi:hypothetical protein